MTAYRGHGALALLVASGVFGGCIVSHPTEAGRASGSGSGDDAGYASYQPTYATSEDDSSEPPAIGPGLGPGGSCPPEAPLPQFDPPTHCDHTPPPISGGTLLVTRDGKTIVAADPDRDQIYVIDVDTKALQRTIALDSGDEPGRLAEDGAGRIHVALRGAGAIATLDPGAGTVVSRRAACPAPRGIGWREATDELVVACATGEIATLPAADGDAVVRHVERDLRDVVLTPGGLAVSTFRSSTVLRIDGDSTVTRRDLVPSAAGFASHVAWRAVGAPNGSVVVVHQEETLSSLQTHVSGGYGCGGGLSALLDAFGDGGMVKIGDLVDSGALLPGKGAADPVHAQVSVIAPDGQSAQRYAFGGVLPVDVAVRGDGMIAVVAAGSRTPGRDIGDQSDVFLLGSAPADFASPGKGQATAVAFVPDGTIVIQKREPAELVFYPGSADDSTVLALSDESREDTGHTIFHTHAGANIACASCHPEGGDDGHVWLLDGAKRRTPSLRGTIAGTAPYHWPGDQKDFGALVHDVYAVRMSGGDLDPDHLASLSSWVTSIPVPPAPSWLDPAAVAAGKALFERADVGCATCHNGAKFTNNTTVDVGSGAAFQVPPLVGVGWRAPFLHDGCAATFADRFGICANARHGNTAQLSAGDIANLTAYLESL